MNDRPEGRKKNRDEIALAYKSEPWWYDLRGFFILTFAYNSTLPRQLRFFGRHIGARHLEVGIGTGTLEAYVLRWRRRHNMPPQHIVGVDYAESMLAGAIRRFRGRTDMEFLHADAADMPLDDASFDTASIANSVHCFPDVTGALAEIFRVLKPGGTLAVNALLYPRGVWPLRQIAEWINNWGIRKGILYSPLRAEQFRDQLVAAGYTIESEAISGNCYEVVARRPAR